MPRGFYTLECKKETNILKNFLFKKERGYIIIPELENRDMFEVGDIIQITITKTEIGEITTNHKPQTKTFKYKLSK